MKCDELIEKIKQADDDYRHKFIPINLDIEIEDLLGAFEELKSENRRLKRVLWLARAENARMNCNYINADWYNGYEKDLDFWHRVEEYCQEKAEEYK